MTEFESDAGVTRLDCSIDAETRAAMHKALDKWLEHCVTKPVLHDEGVHTLKFEAYLVIFKRQYRFDPDADQSDGPRFRKVNETDASWHITVEQRDRGGLDDDEAEAEAEAEAETDERRSP